MIRQGSATVDPEGAVPLSEVSAPGGQLVIQALPGNEGAVHVGDEDVDNESGVSLSKGDVLPVLRVADLSAIYIAGEKEGDGVTYIVSD